VTWEFLDMGRQKTSCNPTWNRRRRATFGDLGRLLAHFFVVRFRLESSAMSTGELRQATDWMTPALEQAEKSWNEGGIPIGSVLVDSSGSIVAAGHNERVQTGDPTAHAEMVAIRRAGRRRDWRELTLVSTLSPCSMCSGTAVLYRIPVVIIGENRTFQGEEDWMKSHGIEIRVLDDSRAIVWMERLKREKPDLWAEDIGE
jgi:cytosine deaminase